MAPPRLRNIFLRLPPATAVLLLGAIFTLTDGHALPRQTKVVAFRELDVIPFPPAPTSGPLRPLDLQLRQENTICGYIGGNSDLPATCSPGSHCVLDAANSVVGCCPNGGACTTGVFTGCVDRNSDAQTEINPYVYTCQGADVCFKNNFAGGYFQYGCGTASGLGTTVQTSAEGATTALSIETVDMMLTQSPSSLATPTTIGSVPSTGTTSSSQTDSQSTSTISSTTTSSSSSSSKTSSSTSSHNTSSKTHGASSSSTATLPTPTTSDDPEPQSQTGAIIGGVVGGAAAVILLIALGVFCLRRRNRNHREGPGPTPSAPQTTQFNNPVQSHGAAFAPLPSWHDEDGPCLPIFRHDSHPPPPDPYGPLEQTRSASSSTFYDPSNLHPPGPYGPIEPVRSAPAPPNMGTASHGFSQPFRYQSAYMPVGMQQPKGSLTPVVEEDQSMEREESHGREIDDFSQAYSSAGIGQVSDENIEEDRTPLRDHPHYAHEERRSSSPLNGGHRPLWQQNRQRGRNLMWL
ncbi:hypothetical protein SAMD00023353_7800560 [Rosellinia necatrix]|uniref:Uncharacterized protein n=1 Tax=Rosellinia necatrix TaxID=77044 RepID=A0A1W2TUN3_ROSNE|nr:hypothetical protein SAMD00023353_7800560 [Rosellinia necatrix]